MDGKRDLTYVKGKNMGEVLFYRRMLLNKYRRHIRIKKSLWNDNYSVKDHKWMPKLSEKFIGKKIFI